MKDQMDDLSENDRKSLESSLDDLSSSGSEDGGVVDYYKFKRIRSRSYSRSPVRSESSGGSPVRSNDSISIDSSIESRSSRRRNSSGSQSPYQGKSVKNRPRRRSLSGSGSDSSLGRSYRSGSDSRSVGPIQNQNKKFDRMNHRKSDRQDKSRSRSES